jgi:putative polyketide hydroxylase
VPWRLEADSAERWRVGNVFLAGDAAHRMTPAGGLGLNTGIQDVHNLCWKLAAVLQGWAGPDLLHTYEIERRPVAQVNVDRSVAIVTGNVDERTGLDVDLGFSYASTAIVPDGSEPPHSNDGDYKPVARPGSRAPQYWLGGARGQVSTLDLFGPRFTLLAASSTGCGAMLHVRLLVKWIYRCPSGGWPARKDPKQAPKRGPACPASKKPARF